MGQTDEGTANMEERLVDVRPALVADGQTAIITQPGQAALHDPAVAAQAGATLHTLPCDADLDTAFAQGDPTARAVIRLVRVDFVWALALTVSACVPLPTLGDVWRQHSGQKSR